MRYCKICKKLIKKKCFWAHLKTFLHKKLFETTVSQKEVDNISINKIKNIPKEINNNIPINKSKKVQKDDELKSSLSKISKRNNNFLIPQCYEYHEKFNNSESEDSYSQINNITFKKNNINSNDLIYGNSFFYNKSESRYDLIFEDGECEINK